MTNFKYSKILKPLGIYKPAKYLQGMSINLARELKSIVYRMRLKKYTQMYQLNEKQNRILIVANGGIGNAVEATPLVLAVRAFWPGSEITLFNAAGDLFDRWCVPDKICNSVEDIEGQNFDHTFLTYACHWGRPDFLKNCNPGTINRPRQYFDEVCLKPEKQYNLDMLRRFGFKGHTPPLYVSLKKPNELPQQNKMRICLLPGGKPESRWQCKRWPHFTKLSEMLIQKYPNCQICIIGTKTDTIDNELKAMDGIIDMRDNLTLAQTAWFLKTAQLVVGNDCGPMHIADAVGSKGIAIFGPTCQLKNGPCNKIIPASLNLPCSPCQYEGTITCQSPDCMRKLTADQILGKIKALTP